MVVMRNLQASVLQRSYCLYKVMSLCAELDCLIALAQASLDHGYCCPTLTSNHRLALIESRYKSSLLMRWIFWFLYSSVHILYLSLFFFQPSFAGAVYSSICVKHLHQLWNWRQSESYYRTKFLRQEHLSKTGKHSNKHHRPSHKTVHWSN